jgi:hypothetical protein
MSVALGLGYLLWPASLTAAADFGALAAAPALQD